jgi:hypothetical protein
MCPIPVSFRRLETENGTFHRVIKRRDKLAGVLRVETGQFVPFRHGDPPPSPEGTRDGQPPKLSSAPLASNQVLRFAPAPARHPDADPVWKHYRPC